MRIKTLFLVLFFLTTSFWISCGETMQPCIVILTGPPGSGKTTIAKQLAKESDVRSVHLHTDDFYHFIIKDRIEPFLPEAHAQNTTVINVIVGAALGYAEGGYFVIVDGIIGDWFLEPFKKACHSRKLDLHYIILKPSIETSLQRAQDRAVGLKDEKPIRDLHRQFTDTKGFKNNIIDSTAHTAEETIVILKEGIAKKKYLLP